MRLGAESLVNQWLRKTWCILYKDGERRFRPSVVAISCVLAARRSLGIVPILSERMKEMTLLEEGYPNDDGKVFDEIGVCYELVCNMQRGSKKLASKEAGSSTQTATAKRQQYLTIQKANVKSQVSTCDRTPRGGTLRKVSNDVDSGPHGSQSSSGGNFEVLSEPHPSKVDDESDKEVAVVKAVDPTEDRP